MNIQRIAYGLITVIAVAVILTYTKVMLIPFVLAVIIWFLIRQVQSLFGRIRFRGKAMPVWLGSMLAFLSICLVLGVVGILLADNIRNITEVLPKYQENVVLMRAAVEGSTRLDLTKHIAEIIRRLDVGTLLTMLINGLTNLLGNVFLMLIYVLFLMLEGRHASRKLVALYADPGSRDRVQGILRHVDESLSRYVTLKTFVSLMTGTLSYVALLIIGVDFAFFWAFVIFLLNYIPTIGSLIATAFPALIAALQFASFVPAVWVLAGVGAIQVLVGNVIEPRLMGNTLNVSPLVVLLSLAFWGSLWGVVGMILSVPITVMLVIVLAQFKNTRWVAVLLSDKGRVGDDPEPDT